MQSDGGILASGCRLASSDSLVVHTTDAAAATHGAIADAGEESRASGAATIANQSITQLN